MQTKQLNFGQEDFLSQSTSPRLREPHPGPHLQTLGSTEASAQESTPRDFVEETREPSHPLKQPDVSFSISVFLIGTPWPPFTVQLDPRTLRMLGL